MRRDRRSLIAAVTALQDQLHAVTATLVDESAITRPATLDDFTACEGPTYASYANALLTARRRLREAMGAVYCADPAFDILLHVFVRDELGVPATLATCAAAGGVPHTTTRRWIGLLIESGQILQRAGDDAAPVGLSDDCSDAIRASLRSLLSDPARVDCRVAI